MGRTETVFVSMCVCERACLCPLQVIPEETVEVIIVKLGTVTLRHEVASRINILTLTFIQGHRSIKIINI